MGEPLRGRAGRSRFRAGPAESRGGRARCTARRVECVPHCNRYAAPGDEAGRWVRGPSSVPGRWTARDRTGACRSMATAMPPAVAPPLTRIMGYCGRAPRPTPPPTAAKAPLMGKTLDRRTADSARHQPRSGSSRTPSRPTASATGARATSGSTSSATSPSTRTRTRTQAIDLKELVDQLQRPRHPAPHPAPLHRHPPAPRRRDRRRLPARPSTSTGTQGDYCCVYPIKVNQQRHVVEEILDFGKPYDFGLEAGSQARAARRAGPDQRRPTTPIICNGFKDDEFIKMVVLARKIGKNIIPVVEKFTELELIVQYAEELGRPAGRSACGSSWPAAGPAGGGRAPATAPSSA